MKVVNIWGENVMYKKQFPPGVKLYFDIAVFQNFNFRLDGTLSNLGLIKRFGRFQSNMTRW